MKFIFPDSKILIYQSIIIELSKALDDLGHTVELFPGDFNKNVDSLIFDVNSRNADYIVISNFSNLFTVYLETHQRFLFEFFDTSIIFIHHDNVFHGTDSFMSAFSRLKAYKAIKEKSCHFCLEYNDYLEMREIGFKNTFPITHASEFHAPKEKQTAFQYDTSFLGHVLPPGAQLFQGVLGQQFFKMEYWKRVCCPGKVDSISLDAFLDYSLKRFSPGTEKFEKETRLLAKYYFVNNLHKESQLFRGELLSQIKEFKVDIFGGDPAYLHGVDLNRCIKLDNFIYHKPVKRKYSIDIFRNSKINLNITSLQFDSAVINRVIDIAMLGRFVLTDNKDSLRKLTSVWKEISYRDTDELNSKIDYYLTHEKQRLEIAAQMQQDIVRKCTYKKVVEYLLDKILNDRTDVDLTTKLDLGCGPRKITGFVGVDVDDKWPGVDVVADLRKKIPYPENSVDEVRAHDLIEHLPDRIHTMNEIWRICKHGAKVDIRVPSSDGRGAFQDPTHVSFWNINSFKYYSVDHPVYLELCRSYGFLGGYKISEIKQERSGDGVIHVCVIMNVVKTTS